MIQSAVYRCSKRVIDQAEGEGIDFPAKKQCVPPSGVQRVVCRFLRSKIDEAAGGSIQKFPVNKPVTFQKLPVNKPVTIQKLPVNKPVTIQKLPVNKPATGGLLELLEYYEKHTTYMDPTTYVYEEYTVEKPALTDAEADAIMHRSAELRFEAQREGLKRGYTQAEFQLCRGFLYKRKFELSLEPLSRDYMHLKMYLDQIRDTRGYGLTLPPSYADGSVPLHNLECIFDEWESDPGTQQYVKKMEEMVLAKIEEKMGRPYKCARLVNLVECNIIRLVTFHVHEEGTAPADAQPPEIAEAYFTMPPIAPMLEHIKLYECKIRKGDKVLFSTALLPED